MPSPECSAAAQELVRLFLPSQPLAILAGAGISLDPPSRLLDGATFMRQLLIWARPQDIDEQWAAALMVRPRGLSRPGEFLRFETLMKALVDSGFDPDLTVLDCLDRCDRPNRNHYILAELIHLGVTVLTTNFDRLIEIAYDRLNTDGWPALAVAIEDEDFPADLAAPLSPALWKLHGSLSRNGHSTLSSVRATVASILAGGAHRPALRFLGQTVAAHDLLVLGYSGWDDLDIVPVISDTPSQQKLLWVDHTDVGQPQMRRSEEIIQLRQLMWERDAVGRDRIWFTQGPEGEPIRDPSRSLSISARTADVMDALRAVFHLRTDYPVDPDPGPFDRGRYFREWRAERADARSAAYAFFLDLTETGAFRKDIGKRRQRWSDRLRDLREEPDATPGERRALLFALASETLSARPRGEKRRGTSTAQDRLERDLAMVRPNLRGAEAITALVLLAQFAYTAGDADRGEDLFTEALNLSESDKDLAGRLKTVETWLEVREWATADGIVATPRVPLVFDPRVTYEHLETLRDRLGRQPSRWLEDVAGAIAEVDDIGWQIGRLHQILRHSVDIGDVVTEARAGEILARIQYVQALRYAESLPACEQSGRDIPESPSGNAMVYHFVLALEESVRVQELGRIVNRRVLEKPNALAPRIESCKSVLGGRLNPMLIEKLKESMWR